MDNDDKVDPDFLKGFNEGYLLAFYMPEAANMIISKNDDSQRTAGFKAGQNQVLAEREINKLTLPPWLRKLNDRDQPPIDNTLDNEKNRDLEPDKD